MKRKQFPIPPLVSFVCGECGKLTRWDREQVVAFKRLGICRDCYRDQRGRIMKTTVNLLA